jgi:Protein of unknown function (DUF2752)
MSTALSQTRSARPVCSNRGQTRPASLQSAGPRLKQWLFAPVLAPLLRRGALVRVLAVVGVTQLIFTAAGLVAWSCPLKSALGIRCPGCGLSTALALLVQGDAHQAVRVHAAAPLALTGMVLLVTCSLLPASWRCRAAQAVARVEERTGMIPLMVIGSLVYWAARCLHEY